MNVADLLLTSAGNHPDKTALIVPGGTPATFAEVARSAGSVAHELRSAGVVPGDRVGIAMGNVPEFVYSYFGVLAAGAAVVPLNPMLTEPEVGRILEDSGAKGVLGVSPAGDAARAAATAAGVRYVTATEWTGGTGDLAPAETGGDDLAVLAYTSGTTGEPKGAMLTHGNLLANIEQQMSMDAHVEPSDVLLLSLPLFHIFGLNVTLGLLVRTGASGVLTERFDPVECLRLIPEHGITVMFGAPTMYTALIGTPGAESYDLSSVRLAISGAAPLPAEVLHRFKELFGVDVYEGYGLTETAPTLTSNRMAAAPRPGSIGKPLPGVEIRLVDESGEDVELGDPGEIIARGPNVFAGYWHKEEETRRAFTPDGWFRTGDVAVQDEDGYLHIVDRKRDLVIVSGFNVFPSEVEQALVENPDVAEAAVVGVPHPYTGEAVKAFVVLAPGARATETELIADVQSRLARFKCPRSIEIVDTLPHLLTGKVLRRALRT
ncbi:MAG TPA: long-chain fatty acid--CoA ligase [Actinomycetota bacterium]|nr:long-chain fatty acid--CoA ligase [Actinomycetota bacterium]